MGELNDIANTVAKLAERTGQPVTTEGIHYAVIPNDHKIESLERLQFSERPIRKKANVQLFDVASFVAYYTLFEDTNSRIFANADQLTFHAILDYHEAGDSGQPRFGDHKATLRCETTDEWDTWFGANNNQMEQTAFALFLEDNHPDIVKPSGAAVLEAARSLKAKKDVEFSSDVNLTNGQIQFKYQESIQGRVGGGELEIPETFTLRFPVFLNGPSHDIEARLRWRITTEKKLVFWYTLVRANKILEKSFQETIKAVEHATKAQVLMGAVQG